MKQKVAIVRNDEFRMRVNRSEDTVLGMSLDDVYELVFQKRLATVEAPNG